MQITVEIPDSLAGQLHLGAKADLRSLLQALAGQQVSEGGLTVVQADGLPKSDEAMAATAAQAHESSSSKPTRPKRDVLARLRGIYGDVPMTGENAGVAARQMERY